MQILRKKKLLCSVLKHGYSNEDDEKSEGKGFICGFNDDFLIAQIGSRELLKNFEFLTLWGNPVIKPQRESFVYLSNLLNRILTEYAESGLKNKLLIQAYFVAVLCELNVDYVPLSIHKNKRGSG